MYQLAVIGNPIEHSLSPIVFGLFARQFNLELNYTKILATDDADFTSQVKHFFDQGGLGLNITSPFKNLAYQTASLHTPRSAFCQAANFIRCQDNNLLADTTDGIGLVQDIIANKQFNLFTKKILIIGSGFVLDSILLDMIVQNPAQISVLARNEERINYLAAKFALTGFNPQTSYDIVFNSTPNLSENTLFSRVKYLPDGALCYDLTYNKTSLFLQYMKKLNNTIDGYNGLGMLVEQAKVAFTALFKYQPDTAEALRQLACMGYK